MRIIHWLRSFLYSPRESTDQGRAIDCGPYELLRSIGGGRVCDVYLAQHRLDSQQVVLKTLPLANVNELNQRRFERESLVLSRLVESDFFVKFIESGTANDRSMFFILEKIDGQTLWDLVGQHGALSDGSAISILGQIASGLGELHALGNLHGDVAPKNILLTGERVKIIDLGLTRPIAASTDDSEHTAVVSGTPAFMSPEACRAQGALSQLSDIYSFGCLAYFLLAAKPPFSGATTIEICWKQIHEQPESLVQQTSSRLTPTLERLIMSCLEKEPEKRPPSMHTIAATLKTL